MPVETAQSKTTQPGGEDSPEDILRFENVTVRFNNEVALDNVSFTLQPGAGTIVYGAAGSGKSVMLKTAIGLIHPDEGRVFLFGRDITNLAEEELFSIRHKVGILFQESGLFDSMAVGENVAYPLLNQREDGKAKKPDSADVDRRVREALRFVELEQTVEKFPSELSGGMRRRVGIARAAVSDPPLMLYDSPTAGLDPITANTIMSLVVKARDTRKTTSVVVTHRHQDGIIVANFRFNEQTGELEKAPPDSNIHGRTRFMVFGKGRLVFQGTEEELNKTQDPYVAKFRSVRS